MRWLSLLLALAPTAAFAQTPPDTGDGARAYVGGVVGGLLPVVLEDPGVGVQFAVRGGVMIRGFQLQLEVAPATAIFGIVRDPFALIDVVGTVGYLIPINDMASWIIRVGGGGGGLFGFSNFNSFRSGFGFGEFRADVAGVAIRTSRHLMVECNAPSLRVMVVDQAPDVMAMWVTNVAINYVF